MNLYQDRRKWQSPVAWERGLWNEWILTCAFHGVGTCSINYLLVSAAGANLAKLYALKGRGAAHTYSTWLITLARAAGLILELPQQKRHAHDAGTETSVVGKKCHGQIQPFTLVFNPSLSGNIRFHA